VERASKWSEKAKRRRTDSWERPMGVVIQEGRAGYGIEELVQVGLVREILALVVRAGVEKAVGFIDDEELPLGVDHAGDELEDEAAIQESPLAEGDGKEARRLAD
jgi:hypothetical protein